MPRYECAICGKSVGKVLVCANCKKNFPLNSPWAQQLMVDERRIRNVYRREEKRNIDVLSDIRYFANNQEYDGWDIVNGDFNPQAEESGGYVDDDYEGYREPSLTPKEQNALLIHQQAVYQHWDSTTAALMLSAMEGNEITAVAYRQRISGLVKKLVMGGRAKRAIFFLKRYISELEYSHPSYAARFIDQIGKPIRLEYTHRFKRWQQRDIPLIIVLTPPLKNSSS